MTHDEHFEFAAAKEVIERVFRKIGVRREYLARDWAKDQQLLRESSQRKRELLRREAELVAIFEGWQHGQPVLVADAEPPEEQRRAS